MKRQTSREISPLTIKPLIFLSWDDCHRPHCGAQPLLSDTATIPEKVTVEECSRVGVPGGGGWGARGVVVSGMRGDTGTAEPFEALSHQMWVPSIYSPSKNVLRAGAERMRHSLQQGGE